MEINEPKNKFMPRLQIQSLSCGYKNERGYTEILKDINFYINKGEIVGLIGEIGSGKTTLLRAITGEILRSGGDIFYEGKSIFSKENYLNFRKKRIYVRQDAMDILKPRYSVEFQIKKLFKGGKYDRSNVERIFNNLGLSMDIMNMLPVQLSDGTRHRVLIAMALLIKPEILLLDEPTTGLDTYAIRGLLELLKEMAVSTSIIMINSDIIPVFQICDRIYVMKSGVIIEDGIWRDILHKPHHPYVKEIITSVPSISNRNKEYIDVDNKMEGGCVFLKKCRHMKEICKSDVPYIMDRDHGYRCLRYPEWYND